MEDKNREFCTQCKLPKLPQYKQWPEDECASENWHTIYTQLFSYNNWLLRTMGKRMRNIINMYSLSIAIVGLDARKIVDVIVTYYRVRYSSDIRYSEEMNNKVKLSTKINSLEKILDKQHPNKRRILFLLREIKNEGNEVAHNFCLTSTKGEEGKEKIIGLLAELMPLFVNGLQEARKDKRCVFFYYYKDGCKPRGKGGICKFTH